LVHPSNMIWPQSLVYVAMYNSLHGNIAETNKKIRFFYIAFASMFIWQFIPSYLFLWLSSIAVLCLVFPSNDIAKLLGSGTRGLGIMNFSLDWNAIGLVSPLITPWWSQVNFYVGLIVAMWIIAPIAYYNNVFDGKNFPIMSLHSFDKDGNTCTSVIDQSTGALNITAYANYSPVYLSVTFAICYGYYFAQFPATIVHVALFHGKEIWTRYKKTRKEELNDIHCRLMSVYPEVPYLWYGIIFISMLIIAIILGYTSGAHLPWWALLLAVAIAAIMVIPIGIIQAISNWAIGLNVITEFVCGYLLPGYPLANVYFKTYGYISMSQCLLFVQDLKMGHYMKVPPRSMFIAQIWGTIVGTIVNFWSTQFIIDAKRHYLDGTEEDPTGQWVGYQSEIFNTASILWGLIGPAKTFGEESLYNILLWGFLIGIFLPIPFYLLHQKYPKAGFNLVNIPVILYGSSLLPGYNTNFIISGFIVSFIFQFYVFRYKKGWWTRYNYVMAGAFDSAAQIVTMFILICLGTVTAPIWWGTDPASQ
ncbi:10242_t:CDS:10, partial [Scutellospora calospora]